MTRIQDVIVTITIETNKESHRDKLAQQDDESFEDFVARVSLALTELKEGAL